MARYDNTKRNQYNSTPRKVFDAALDRLTQRRLRDKEEHRNDIAALLARLETLEDHVAEHCKALDGGKKEAKENYP